MVLPPMINTPLEVGANSRHRECFDVVIVGAGFAGINMARYITTSAPPKTSYIILERRGRLGGTWDLFHYPGIRSDSDMFTFGFSWKPWRSGKLLAGGPKIASYLSESAAEVGADRNTRFHQHVLYVRWSSPSSMWTVTAKTASGELMEYEARFIVLGTGYYNYDEPMLAPIPGLDDFRGDLIRPQFWPENYSYVNKSIVVVGSGATAVTLLPSLAEDARHVTMLQRSPTYIASLPTSGSILTRLCQAILPRFITDPWNRFHHILMGYMLYYYCRAFPNKARHALEKESARQLPRGTPVKPHFCPEYNPWEQRLCVCPDGDFYAALRSGKASVITADIEKVTAHEIVLKSGQRLQPDTIVAATGLQLQFAGGIEISIDEETLDPSTKFTWKGCMLQDVPNLAFVVGYVNASWTLGAETTAGLLARLWRRMEAQGASVATPTLSNPETMLEVPLFNLSSTYLQNSAKVFPKAGTGQWAQKKNYFVDVFESRWGNISDGLVFRRHNE